MAGARPLAPGPDALAVLELVTYPEQRCGFDVAESGIDPEDLASIRGILDLIDRVVARGR